MNPDPPLPLGPRRGPAGPRWILAGFGLLLLSWLGFMGHYVWQATRRPPPSEPPPVQTATNQTPPAPGTR